MKQLQALLRLKNPDAANELSKEIDRMKSLVQKKEVSVKRNAKLEKNVERRKQREKERKIKNALEKNN